jgi:putative ABC transport system permease protein
VWKEFRAGPALFLLTVAGVGLGVASVLSIQILNQAALGAFAGTVRAISGDADLAVVGWAGELPEDLLPSVLATPGVRSAAPLYRTEVAVEGRPGLGLEVVGADLLAGARGPWALRRGDLGPALGTPGWMAVTPALAAEQGWKVGDLVPVSSGSRRVTLRVGTLVDLQSGSPLASRRLVAMDLAQTQALLGVHGRITEIDVSGGEGQDRGALAASIEARLGGRARVIALDQRQAEAAGLLSAFRLNLTALSLVSLLVGGFLVYAAIQASLVRRREELGVLRAVGATRTQVLGLVLAEASVLGLLGTALGIPVGTLAARANIGAVSGTLRNLYLLEGIERAELTPTLVLVAAAVGVGGALGGALIPALDASRRDPRALLASLSLQEETEARARPLLAAGLAAAAAALAFQRALARWPPAGFILAVGVLAAVALAAPAVVRSLGFLGRPRRLAAAWGMRTLPARLRTAAVAAGALAVAVSMLCGITVMIGSFRVTVDRWLGRTLRADVYVTTPSWRRARSEATLAPEVAARLAADPEVVGVDFLRQVQGLAEDRRVSISGVDAALPVRGGRVDLLAGDPSDVWRAVRSGAALVSEPLARKAGLRSGGTVRIRTAGGTAALPVAGVYHDYGTESGAVMVDLGTFARLFGEGPPSNAALYLRAGADPEAAVVRLRAALGGAAVLVRSQRALRGEVLALFDQTFAVTRLLQAMGLLIAVAGIALSLLVLARERAAELALYRALGATRAQLFAIFLGRGMGIALAGIALGALGGAALAAVLVKVVNPSFFGWTIALHPPWGALAREGAAILGAAAAASAWPAIRASATPAGELSRDAL